LDRAFMARMFSLHCGTGVATPIAVATPIFLAARLPDLQAGSAPAARFHCLFTRLSANAAGGGRNVNAIANSL